MPRKSKPQRPDFRVEIKDGKFTLQTRARTLGKLWIVLCMIVIALLIILSLLQPEGWLDILRAVLLLLQPALTIGAGARSRSG
jgi:hypothetical protein